jgi:hypothetical protein
MRVLCVCARDAHKSSYQTPGSSCAEDEPHDMYLISRCAGQRLTVPIHQVANSSSATPKLAHASVTSCEGMAMADQPASHRSQLAISTQRSSSSLELCWLAVFRTLALEQRQ